MSTTTIRLKRYRPGWYEHESGYVTYRYEEQGPRGGQGASWWNICHYDADGFLVSTGEFEPTLADARARIARLLECAAHATAPAPTAEATSRLFTEFFRP